MRLWRSGLACMLCAGLGTLGGTLGLAADTSSLREEIADMEQAMSSMEARLDSRSEKRVYEDAGADMLVTMEENALIQIGGEVAMDVRYKVREDLPSGSDEVSSTQFETSSANLRFKVNATRDSYVYIKLDLDDFQKDERRDGIADQDDLLEECKFVWEHIRGSCWGMVFGKGEAPYGQDKTIGIIQSYHHNNYTDTSEGPVYIVNATEGQWNAATVAAIRAGAIPGNPHADVGFMSHPGEIDNVYMIGVNYVHRDFLKWEFAVFQNNDPGRPRDIDTKLNPRGHYEDGSDDDLFFDSWATRFWLLPSPNLTVELSFVTQTIESFDDAAIGGANSTDRQSAYSLGFEYCVSNQPVTLFGEFQHGFDWNYQRDYSADILQLGLIYGFTNQLDWGLMAETMELHDGHDQDYYKLVTNLKYTWDTGIYMIGEIGYEYADDQDPDLPGNDNERDGWLIAFRAGWSF